MYKLSDTDIIYSIQDFPFDDVANEVLSSRKVSSAHSHYLGDFGTFDIETTTYIAGYKDVVKVEKLDPNSPSNPKHHKTTSHHEIEPDYNAFMYIWQFCIADRVIMGRTWPEFIQFMKKLREVLQLTPMGNNLVIYVHNLGYEFQFMRNFFSVVSVFALNKRKVAKCIVDDVFEFRCSYRLSNMELAKFLQNSKGVVHYKKEGKLDYTIIRTPSTQLSDEELMYCYNDVMGLREGVMSKLTSDHDTLGSIPLTSTGYVRRSFRAASRKNPANYFLFKQLQLNNYTYKMCKEAVRGGNTHANPGKSNQVLKGVGSEDMSSAYPAIMCQCKFPMTPFLKRRPTKEKLYELLNTGEYALLMRVAFTNLKIIQRRTVAYISKSKCRSIKMPRSDNGRILSCDYCEMTITDIDLRIIMRQYKFDEDNLKVLDLYSSKYAYLPTELRNMIVEQYKSKCELKFGDKYLYGKYKNEINADFGMMLTDICRPEITFDPYDTDNPFKKAEADEYTTKAMLTKYYKSQNSFLSYQWGLWVTAHCRNRLQKAIDRMGIDMVYCDTDSCKFMMDFNDHKKDFEELNEEILAEAEACGVETSCDVYNPKKKRMEHFQLGIWEEEDPYEEFKTMGAKKYAYNQYNDETGEIEFGITVAGLSKVSGAEYLREHGGMNAFNESTNVPPEFSGRTTAFYKDVIAPYYIHVNGESILTGSAIALVPSSYTFSLDSDYRDLLAEIEADLEAPLA